MQALARHGAGRLNSRCTQRGMVPFGIDRRPIDRLQAIRERERGGRTKDSVDEVHHRRVGALAHRELHIGIEATGALRADPADQ